MATHFDHRPTVEHQHDVGVREGCQAVRAEDDRDPLLRRRLWPERLPERSDDGGFGRHVDG